MHVNIFSQDLMYCPLNFVGIFPWIFTGGSLAYINTLCLVQANEQPLQEARKLITASFCTLSCT